jgi:hypothetical protein
VPMLWRRPVLHVEVTPAQTGGPHGKEDFSFAWCRTRNFPNLDLPTTGQENSTHSMTSPATRLEQDREDFLL